MAMPWGRQAAMVLLEFLAPALGAPNPLYSIEREMGECRIAGMR